MIYFVRHGETEYNVLNLMQGHKDIPLNENGIHQAKIARDELKDLKIDEIYSSPLIRAYKTAEIINEYHNIPIKTDDRIKEFYAGRVEGTKISEWDEETREKFFANPENYGAETWEQFYNRVVSFYKEIENAEKNILVVAHNGVYRNIYRYINNIDSYHFQIDRLKNSAIVPINNLKR